MNEQELDVKKEELEKEIKIEGENIFINKGGTDDYTELNNKPQINGVELIGNRSLEELGINQIDPNATIPAGGTTGQVLSKNSDSDYDTIWKTMTSSSSFIRLVGTEEEPYDLSTGPDEPGIYLIKGYYRLNPSSSTTYNAQGGIFLFNTLWNFENRQEADQNIARIMMDINKGFRVKTNNKTKNSPSTSWTSYQLNPVNSTGASGNKKESMSTALFVNLTGINDYTNLSSLQTTDKSSLIAAINELKTELDALKTQ